MGYYTRYKLTLHEPSSFVGREEELIAGFRKACDGAEFALTEHGNSYEATKWYSHDEDLRKFSRMYPDVVFKLTGEGEESGDQWCLYVKNGRSQMCQAKITYDDYDEQKLV